MASRAAMRRAVRRGRRRRSRRPSRDASAAGSGATIQPFSPSRTNSSGPPLSVHGDHRLCRRERLDGHEAVVLALRHEHHGAAAREMIDQRGLVESCPANVTRSARPSSSRELLAARPLLAVAADHAAHAARRGLRERAQDQIGALQRRSAARRRTGSRRSRRSDTARCGGGGCSTSPGTPFHRASRRCTALRNA